MLRSGLVRQHHLLGWHGMTIHLRPPPQHHIPVLPILRPHTARLPPALLHLLAYPVPFLHATLVSRDPLELLLVVVLPLDEPSALLALEVERTPLSRAGGYGGVGLSEEAFGLLVAVAQGGKFSSL